MKRVVFLFLLVGLIWAGDLKPYVMGATSSDPLDVVITNVKSSLSTAGFKVLGEYQPAHDEKRWVIVVSSDEMLSSVEEIGGLSAFAAALRIGLTVNGDQVEISYTDPIFLGNAYFQTAFKKVAPRFESVSQKLVSMMSTLGDPVNQAFGMEEGMSPKEVAKYHYMFGMEYFQDVVELTEFSSYEVAKSVIRSKLSKGGDTQLVYSVEIPGHKATLYGIALSGDTGEEHFLPIIDVSTPRHTAFLPYEILLLDTQAVMMHGRYRIALAFPDLTMTTFSKIMSTPGDIEELMRSVTE